ncbi:hypothetical protein F2Q68_00004127 [Brassica cretica]|uniref:Bidirectional sugar transporter SWEET n=1 Tax=Brassica cretica TaxID=69181 RepID=A0A8S9JCJ5_BRACR|nr:hypothetical protein F2Q68_00004127 [Brassica cretica]
MTDAHTTRTIVGIIGNMISFGLFCAPIPTMVKIWKMKSVSEFKPDPYVATVLNCMMWTFYGLPFVQPDSLLVITINGTGLFMELVYVTIFFIFATSPIRRKITIAMMIEVIFMAVVIFCTLYFLPTTKQRSMLIGILCIVFNVIMYASPLTVMIPNGLGSISGIVQLILYATYYKTTNWNDEDDDKEKGSSNAEIELGRA